MAGVFGELKRSESGKVKFEFSATKGPESPKKEDPAPAADASLAEVEVVIPAEEEATAAQADAISEIQVVMLHASPPRQAPILLGEAGNRNQEHDADVVAKFPTYEELERRMPWVVT